MPQPRPSRGPGGPRRVSWCRRLSLGPGAWTDEARSLTPFPSTEDGGSGCYSNRYLDRPGEGGRVSAASCHGNEDGGQARQRWVPRGWSAPPQPPSVPGKRLPSRPCSAWRGAHVRGGAAKCTRAPRGRHGLREGLSRLPIVTRLRAPATGMTCRDDALGPSGRPGHGLTLWRRRESLRYFFGATINQQQTHRSLQQTHPSPDTMEQC